jgi:single-stranded-DNA-specific exonuclease
MQWQILPHDAALIKQIEQAAGVSSIVAKLLANRRISHPDQARSFLDSSMLDLRDPLELPGIAQASALIWEAIQGQRSIFVYGDYDADGMTSTAILVRCIELLGGKSSYYIPNRLDEGYGLSEEALRSIAERGAELVVTVDCGIASVNEARLARQLGLTLIITDHHQMGVELPDAAAIVHPKLPGQHYEHSEPCGAGVAFKLAWALCQLATGDKKVAPAQREFLLVAMGLAAIGTVADMVPLTLENRIIVRHGLKSLYARPPLGLSQLMKVSKLSESDSITSEDIAFNIAPRLNAAGRLGQAPLAVELMTTQSTERAAMLAEYINNLNGTRERLERSVSIAATKQIKEQFQEDDPAFVLFDVGWHVGVIGIVAGKIAEKYGRPAVVITGDEAGNLPCIGSARSGGALNLHDALRGCSEHLLGFGGHAAAAGMQIDRSMIETFRHAFVEQVAGITAASSGEERPLVIDVEALFTQLDLNSIRQMELLAPFGQQNPRPVFCSSQVRLANPPKKIGGGERHLSVELVQHQVKMRGVAFGRADWADALQQLDEPIDIAYRPVINTFGGRHRVEVQLVDWRPSFQQAPTTVP